MAKIITTVGTSIITNFSNGIEGKFNGSTSLRSEIKNIEKKPYNSITRFPDDIQKIKSELLPFLQTHKDEASAEIKSLNKILSVKINEPSIVFLICTDSIESFICAELIKESDLVENITQYNIIVIPNLKVTNYGDYKNGLVNLVTQIFEIISKDKNGFKVIDSNIKTVFNITGGFKGIIPYVTLMGQLLKLPLFYIFENTEELIEIPQLPIQFDWAFTEKYYFALSYERSADEAQELRKLGFIRKNGEYTGLGYLFRTITEINYQKSAKALGLIVELKLYEYYTQKNIEGYKYAVHSDNTLNPPDQKVLGGETDLVLSKYSPKLENDSIIFEVKSIFELNNKKIISQFENKIELLKKKNIIPSEFIFYFYSLSYDFERFISSTRFMNNIKEIKSTFEKTNFDIKLSFKFQKIKIREKKDDNILNEFLTNPIKSEDIKPINI